MDNRMTDYMRSSADRGEGQCNAERTSHNPDEVVGKMAAHTQMVGIEVFPHWSYTVKTVAVNAVMAA